MRRFAAKTIAVVLTVTLLAITVALPVSAISSAPYEGYSYDPYGVATASPLGYLPDGVEDYKTMNLETPLKSPNDVFVYNGDQVWIADTGNNRIVMLDSDYNYVTEYDKFVAEDGTEYPLVAPQSIYIKHNVKEDYDEIFVCCNINSKDKDGNEKKDGYVVTAGTDGVVRHIYRNPADSITAIKDFQPLNVVADNSGYVYVLANGILEGLIVYKYDTAEFTTYFGANKVVLTWQLVVQQTWKKIFSRDAAATMIQAVPTEMSNIFIDDEGFIYTTTATSTVEKDLRVRKLNATGANTLQGDANALVDVIFGDRDVGTSRASGNVSTIDTRLCDITVDEEGNMAVLDAERGRVYIYDPTCMQLTEFGYKASGNVQDGATANPVAIAKNNDQYILLDADRGAIVKYRPTEYMHMLLEANRYYLDGYYVKGEPYWRNVLKYDANVARGYAAVGKALNEQHKYSEALQWLKQGQDRTSYSLALAEYRKEYLRQNYWWFVPVVVVAVVLFVLLFKFIQKCLGIKKKAKRIKFS